jgi:16S rRNA (adenine1518-N6/adenine1519-N6)-dimethyltransferase
MNASFEPKKSLGQNFLTSDYVPNKMCDAAELEAGELVLEIGPGTGVLTSELLKRGCRVIALEADTRAISLLHDTFAKDIASGTLTVIAFDVRSLSLPAFGLKDHGFSVVANIPYYLTGHLLRVFLETSCQPKVLVFLMQKEVAQRIARDPKESLLSLSVKAFGTATYVQTISRGHFSPPPAVDSAILKVSDISMKNLRGVETTVFFSLLQAGLHRKRGQLLGNLSRYLDREVVSAAFAALCLPATVRGEDLPLRTWVELATILSPHYT